MSAEAAQPSWRQISVSEFALVEPMLRATVQGQAFFTLDADCSDDDLRAYWFGGVNNETWVLEENDVVLGSFYQRSNQPGLGRHIANGGYVVAEAAKGRGIGRVLGERSIERAHERGFRGIQFNFVVSSNTVAVHLWQSLGFAIIGTIPNGYLYKSQRYENAYIMFKDLTK